MALVKVTRKGQVTIPKEIRESLGVEEGDVVEVKAEGGVVLVKPTGNVKPHRRLTKREYQALVKELDRMREEWR